MWRGFLGAAVFGIVMFAGARPAAAQQDILIGGAAVSGLYHQVAAQTCAVLNRHAAEKYNCVGRPSLGSVFNINAVERGLLDFGVAQSDSNYHAARGEQDWASGPVKDLRSVFSVHSEGVLLVTRAAARINAVRDLRGKRVNIGNAGSGQRGNAEDVLRLHGLDRNSDIKPESLQQNEASRALIDGKIDAFFYTVGSPNASIREVAESTDIRIVDLNSRAVTGFVEQRPYYVMTRYPDGLYRGVGPFETYAVKATVVASAAASEEMVYDFVRTIFENLDELKGSHPAFSLLEPSRMLLGLTAPLHPGAVRYYRERGWL